MKHKNVGPFAFLYLCLKGFPILLQAFLFVDNVDVGIVFLVVIYDLIHCCSRFPKTPEPQGHRPFVFFGWQKRARREE